MTDLFLLSEGQMRRIERYFPRSHGIARVDDRRIVSAIVFVIKNGLRWRDALREYGPHKTIYNRFVRWSRMGVFNKIFAALARTGGKPERIMIDATHLKAHRTAASLLKKGLFPDVSGAPLTVKLWPALAWNFRLLRLLRLFRLHDTSFRREPLP
jgi:putative transposase